MKPVYSIVVPVYNEELVVFEAYKRLTAVMRGMDEPYEILFVNDGSRDKTEQIAAVLCAEDERVRLISFSRNFGHQSAITAGMEYAGGDAVVIIDADMQDPPEVIPKMAALWKQGFDVVYGKRVSREGETRFKKLSAALYYRFLRGVTNVDIPVDTGDFRLIGRNVCDAMKSLGEKNRYVRGLVSWVGFSQTGVEYERERRFAGETKYPLKKMVKFAVDGVTAFSYKPLRLATYLGLIISLASFIYLAAVVIGKLAADAAVPGWTSIIAAVLLTQGIVLIMLGLMGEYVGRIFDEIKNRPVYIVKEVVGFGDEGDNR